MDKASFKPLAIPRLSHHPVVSEAKIDHAGAPHFPTYFHSLVWFGTRKAVIPIEHPIDKYALSSIDFPGWR
jgi:hypothetical protein